MSNKQGSDDDENIKFKKTSLFKASKKMHQW